MTLHIVHTFLKCICEFLDDLRVFFHVTCFYTVGCVRHIPGCFPKRCHHMACAFFFQNCGRWLKLYGIRRRIIPCKSRRRGTEINTLVNGQIFLRVNAVFLQDIFKYHFRHATFSPAKNFLSFQIFPLEIRHLFSCNKKISRALGQLGEVHGRIGCPFLTGIDGCFRSHKSNIRFPGDQRSQHFICSESSYQCKIQTFFFKISFFDCHILRRIENRMGYFIQCNFSKLLFCSIPLCSKYSRRQCCHSQDNSCRQ